MLALVLVLALAGAQPDHTVTVLRLIDGDTIEVLDGARRDRIRLLRVDTPERGARGADDATDALARLITGQAQTRGEPARRAAAGRTVALEYETPGRPERDRYGRLLAYVYARGQLVNLGLVEQGWSRFLTRFGAGHHAADFARAERDARRQRRGLWACGCLK